MKTERMAVLDVFDAWKAANLSGQGASRNLELGKSFGCELQSDCVGRHQLAERSSGELEKEERAMSIDDFKNSKEAERLTDKLAAQPSEAATVSAGHEEAFERWWASGVHKWNPDSKMAEYELARQAWLAAAQPLTPNAGEARLPSDVADFLVSAASFLRSRDNMNATLHLADVRLSPLTQKAVELVDRYKIGPQPALAASTPAGPTPAHVCQNCGHLENRHGASGCVGYYEKCGCKRFVEAGAAKEAGGGLCGKCVVHFIAGASWFPCALLKGHEGDCRAAGECFKHGKYLGEPHKPPQCPQWPDCAALAPDKPQPSETRTCEHEE